MKNNFPMHWVYICPTDNGHKKLFERLSNSLDKELEYNSMMHDAIDTTVSVVEQDLAKKGYTLKPSTEAPTFSWLEPSPRYTKSEITNRRKKNETLPTELHWKLSIPELEEQYSKKKVKPLLIGKLGISFEQMPNIWCPVFSSNIYGYPNGTGAGRILLQGSQRKKQYHVVIIGMSCGWTQERVSDSLAKKIREAFPIIAENKNLYFGPYSTIANCTPIDGIQSLLMIPENLNDFSIKPLIGGIIELGNIALNRYSN